MTTNNKPEIKIGDTYFAASMQGTPVIPLMKSPGFADRILFVSPRSQPTPFVVWSTYVYPTATNLVDLTDGRYYKTLAAAILYDPDFCNGDHELFEEYLGANILL